MKRSSYFTPFLVMILLSFGLKKICAEDTAEEQQKKHDQELQNAWEVNPFAKNKYVPPYPPDKYTYKMQDDRLIYKGTYSYETKMDGKLFSKEEGEDLYVDFINRNPKKIDLQTGSKYGIGTLKEEIKLLSDGMGKSSKDEDKDKDKDKRTSIKRDEKIIKILEKSERKVLVFDLFRYKFRHPLKFYMTQDDKPMDITQQLYDSALLGYLHSMIQTQMDEAGLLTEEGGNLAKRDEKEDLSNRIGPIYNWWNAFFNHWCAMEEFPILPADIDYVRQRRYFMVENMNADWDVTLREAKSEKSTTPVDLFCKRWWGGGMKEIFNRGITDFSFKGIKPIMGFISDQMKKSEEQYKTWVKGEFKEKYLKSEDLYSLKDKTRHKESEPISRRADNTSACVNNECEFVGKEKIDITGLDGKVNKYTCLHFRRTVTVDDLGIPVLKLEIKKWQDDIWFDTSTRLAVKRDFALDFENTFISQMLIDPRNPAGPLNKISEVNGASYNFTMELVDKSPMGTDRSAELKEFKEIVNSFNNAVGSEYKTVLEKLEKYKAAYVDKAKDHELATPVETMTRQCKNMSDMFTQSKGFKKNSPIFADEYFCTYVPEDFNPADKYGLIVYLPDENENVEDRIKELGSLLLGKKFIALGYRPQMNRYDHKFNQSAARLLSIIRGVGTTYNIDPKRRYMMGPGKGAQMVLSMLPYTLSDFDRFSLYIPLSAGYLAFAEDCRKNINSPQGGNYQQAIFTSNVLVMNPNGTKNVVKPQEMIAPDACTSLGGAFANIRLQNPKFDKYVCRLIQPEKDVYNKAVGTYILNQIIPKFEKGAKDFFENPANTPGLQPLPIAVQAPPHSGAPAPTPAPAKEETPKKDDPAEKDDPAVKKGPDKK